MGLLDTIADTTRNNTRSLGGLLGLGDSGNGLLSDLDLAKRNALSRLRYNVGKNLQSTADYLSGDPNHWMRQPATPEDNARMDQALMDFGSGMVPGALGGIVQKIGTAGLSSTSRMGERGALRPKIEILTPEPGMRIGQRISTANPTPVQAEKIGFHSTPEYEITSQLMRENPEAFAHNMRLMSSYMPTKKRSPEGQYEDYLDHITGNLTHLMRAAPKDFIGRSSNWYKGANSIANDFSDAYDIPIEASAAVLARLSPGMDWFQNVEQADRLIDIWRNQQNSMMPSAHWNGGTSAILQKRPELANTKLSDMKTHSDKADWIRAFDEQTTPGYYYGLTPEGALTPDYIRTQKGDPASMMWQSNDNLSRAIAMLEDPAIENISKYMGSSGHKIRNFFNNIVDPFHPVDTTVDTHAVSSGLVRPFSQQGLPVQHAFGGGAIKGGAPGTAKSGMATGTYGLFADAYRKAGKELGMIPQTVQSPTWELIRENFPTSGVQKDALRQRIEAGPFASLKKGLLSPDEFREQTLDLATNGKGLKFPAWYSE